MPSIKDENKCSFSCSIPGFLDLFSELFKERSQFSETLVCKDYYVFFSGSEPFYSFKDILCISIDLRNIFPTFFEVIVYMIVFFVLDYDPFTDIGLKLLYSSFWLLFLYMLKLIFQKSDF